MAKCAAMLKDIKNSTEIEMHVKLEKKNAGHLVDLLRFS